MYIYIYIGNEDRNKRTIVFDQTHTIDNNMSMLQCWMFEDIFSYDILVVAQNENCDMRKTKSQQTTRQIYIYVAADVINTYTHTHIYMPSY